MVPWREAWQDALYGAQGFYRRPEGPAGHFATSTHPPLGAVFAELVLALARREGRATVVDIGCGRGELLIALHALAPQLHLVGVDVVERPSTLPAPVDWVTSPGGDALPPALRGLDDVLVIANEWLDVVPCTVAEVDPDEVLREVLVDVVTGAESLGAPLAPEDLAWVRAHWPADLLGPGARLETGLTRERAWDDLVGRVRRGTVLAVDYGHTAGDRPPGGTLTGYARGLPALALPDGSCDLTAHVAMDTLAGAEVRTQRAWVRELLGDDARPPHDLARTDPSAYVAALSRRGVIAQLADPEGLGGFLWATRRLP